MGKAKKKVKIDKPTIAPIPEISFPLFHEYHLDGGLQVYELRGGMAGVCKMDVIFYSGRPFELKKTLSRAATSLIKEGTTLHSSADLAEFFDYHGSTLSVFSTMDHGGLTLLCLSRYFEKMLPEFIDVLHDAVFPEEEVTKFKQNAKEKLKEDLSRNDAIAYRKITEEIFGVDHPYGYNSSIESIVSLSREDMLDHYRKTYVQENGYIVLSGDIPENSREILNKYFSKVEVGQKAVLTHSMDVAPKGGYNIYAEGANDHQNSIRIGMRTVKRGHPDFPGLALLDNLFGGYFGSRLMRNIREDLGLTYNIYSNIELMYFDAYWMISTETSNENAGKTVDQIKKEMKSLRTTLVTDKELDMARNYLLGNLLTSLDSTFSIASMHRNLLCEGSDPHFLNQIIEEIKGVTPKDLLELSNKYLNWDDFITVVVGTKV